MGLLNLKWFRSERDEQLEKLKVEEQIIKNDILRRELQILPEKDSGLKSLVKPYLNIKLVNTVLTIVLNDGNILSKPNATQEDFMKARSSSTEEELFKLASCNEVLEEKRKKDAEIIKTKALIEGLDNLKDLEDFVIEDGSVYLKGVKRSMPQLLVERFIELQSYYECDEHFTEGGEYQALKKFWLKCCLNPNAQSAEDLYKFLNSHQFKIDKHGNFYAYRRVVSKGGKNKALVEFVSNTYNKIKAIWKKKPVDYFVHETEDGGYSFNREEFSSFNDLGNLQELYLNLPNMQEDMYTSAHTGQEDYRVGSTISMPRNDGDDSNNVSCSKGFHAASKAYDYSGFGNTPILVIINPMDVLAVPHNEDGKLRTCRWFFASVLSEDEKYILDEDDFDVSELGDVFEEQCLMELQNYVQNSFAEEVKRHTFSLPNITASEISTIVHSLEEMKDLLSRRVVYKF